MKYFFRYQWTMITIGFLLIGFVLYALTEKSVEQNVSLRSTEPLSISPQVSMLVSPTIAPKPSTHTESVLPVEPIQPSQKPMEGSPSQLATPKQPIHTKPPIQSDPSIVPDSINSPENSTFTLTNDEQLMLELVNQAREQAGLNRLKLDEKLATTARLKSQNMIEQNYFSHQSPRYGSPFDMMDEFEITYQTAGENIACNQTTDQAHIALMNSPGHRANILKDAFTHIGIGIVDGGPCGQMYTQMFVGR
jgi:uncharacterized YkwD family protein